MGRDEVQLAGRRQGRRVSRCRRPRVGQIVKTEFYTRSNGDRWILVADPATGGRLVRHEPALPSGGCITEVPVEVFLERTGESPENLALREMLER